MKLVKNVVSLSELNEFSTKMFGNLVKAVVDIEQGIMVIDAPMHSDEEEYLLNNCDSKQENLWGVNLYPKQYDSDFIEFDSMINIRPNQNNYSRNVENPEIQERIKIIINKFVKNE